MASQWRPVFLRPVAHTVPLHGLADLAAACLPCLQLEALAACYPHALESLAAASLAKGLPVSSTAATSPPTTTDWAKRQMARHS